MNKTRKIRKSPIESATSLPEGTIKGDWVIKKALNGVPRWVSKTSVNLNGYKLFTTDDAAKHIGKTILLYSREFKDSWPKKPAWSKPEDSTHVKYKFTPNGDATKEKTKIEGWLKSRKPEIKKGTHFYINGEVYYCDRGKYEYLTDQLQVNSSDGKTISVNLLNIEMFIMV